MQGFLVNIHFNYLTATIYGNCRMSSTLWTYKPCSCDGNDEFRKIRGNNLDNIGTRPNRSLPAWGWCVPARPSTPLCIQKSMAAFTNSNVEILDWPGNSPDLSRIENLWAIVKQRLRKRDCTTKAQMCCIGHLFQGQRHTENL